METIFHSFFVFITLQARKRKQILPVNRFDLTTQPAGTEAPVSQLDLEVTVQQVKNQHGTSYFKQSQHRDHKSGFTIRFFAFHLDFQEESKRKKPDIESNEETKLESKYAVWTKRGYSSTCDNRKVRRRSRKHLLASNPNGENSIHTTPLFGSTHCQFT